MRAARFLVPACAVAVGVPGVPAGAALLLGLALALGLGNPHAALTKRWSAPLLQVSVVGLGFGADLRVVLEVGLRGVGYTFVGIAATLLAGAAATHLLGVRRDTGALISVGTAICGGSAIAAVVPAIGAKEEDATVSLAVVFLLNAVGLWLFPPLGRALGLDPVQFGTWAALAIHDTSSVVGAAAAFSAASLPIATTLKLTRALWIAPVALAAAAWAKASGGSARPKAPWFVLGFLVAAGLATFVPVVHDAGPTLAAVARRLLVVSLFFVGVNVSRDAIRAVGARPLWLGVGLWSFSAGASLAAIWFGVA